MVYPQIFFDVPKGVKQRDPLSASLFSIYINGLIDYANELNIGIDIDGRLICIVLYMYADDMVLIGKIEPWASKTARHNFEGLDMQRNE